MPFASLSIADGDLSSATGNRLATELPRCPTTTLLKNGEHESTRPSSTGQGRYR